MQPGTGGSGEGGEARAEGFNPASLQENLGWLLGAGQETKRRFLTGILLRCGSTEILENLQNVLQVTSRKDFTYARSRVKADGVKVECRDRGEGGLDARLIRTRMMDLWEKFSRSPHWAKSKYLLEVLSQCDTELLHMLGNLVRVLIARYKRGFLLCNTAGTDDDCSSVSESHYSFHSGDHPEMDLLVQASTVYGPVSFSHETQVKNVAEISYRSQLTKKTIWSELGEQTIRSQMENGSNTDSDSLDDPALMVVPCSSKSMSGVSLHRDFIRGLPVEVAKRILGLLDTSTLRSCRRVSQHWRYLTEEILVEIKVKKMIENQAMVLQGSTSSGVNPVYARISLVLVPLGEEEKYIHPLMSSPKNTKDVMDFGSVYTGVKTKAVELEERNVYCGVFNVLVLLDREDPSRVIHYSGGQMVAVGSKDRMVRLLDVRLLKEVPPLMQGHAGSVRAVLVCEERALVISASYDLHIRCWNLKTGVCTMLLYGHMGTINCLDLHGNLLVSGARDCRVKVWNLKTGRCCAKLKFRHRKPIVCVKISASVVLSGCEGGLVKMWDLETAVLLKVIDGHQGCVKCLFFDQWHILSGGSDGQVQAWSTNSDFKKSLMSFHHPKEVLTLSLAFLRVITGCVDGKIRIFNFLSGHCLRVIKISTHQSPVLSLYTHDNSILVNSSSRVLLLRFAEQCWDYTAVSERRFSSALHHPLHGSLYAERKTVPASSGPKSCKRDWKAKRQVFSHHIRSRSAPSMRQTLAVQQESIRPATCSELQDLQTSRLSSGRPVSGRSLGARSRASHTPRSSASDSEKPLVKYKMTPSERAVRERVRKRGVHHPVTTAQVLLKVRPTQQPHSCDLASSNMELNAAVRDAWGPPPSDQAQGLQTKTSPAPPPPEHPKRPHSIPQPSEEFCFKGTVKIYTPLRTHRVDLNLQHSLHSRNVRSSIPSPTLIRPQTGLGFHKSPSDLKSKARRSESASSVRKVGTLTTTAEEDVQNLQKMFMRSIIKHPGRQVNFEMPRKPRIAHVPQDPFRDHGGFQLKTDTELEEFVQTQSQHHTPTHTSEDQERQRKTAWKLKIKGLPPNDYTKQDQVYAPELGQDTYI